MTRLAICAIFKNEAPYLLEWIAYHRIVGVDHFYLYDNDSTDGGSALIQRSGLASAVTLIDWPQRPGQLAAYSHFINHHAPSCEWAAFIDLDEFLLPLYGRSITPMLDHMQTASAILVHWRVFGPSGWDQRPEGLVLDNYTMRARDEFPANRHVKSIVKCADLLDVSRNPHEFRLLGHAYDTQGRPVPNMAIQETACHANLVLNHYQTRSRQDWLEKIHRGSAMIERTGPKYDADLFDHYAEISIVQDETIRAFVPEVRAALAHAPMAAWTQQGEQAWAHRDGLAMVYRDNGVTGVHWLAALRRSAAGPVDPSFLVDTHGRIHTFPSDLAAIDACEAALRRWMDGVDNPAVLADNRDRSQVRPAETVAPKTVTATTVRQPW